VRGSLVIQERVTELLDIETLLADPQRRDTLTTPLVAAGVEN
jgi:hypothetical protein